MYHLAQVNIALTKYETNDPRMAEFMEALDAVNALAEKADGFVWRLKGDNNNATAIRVFENDRLLINMSVWESIDALFQFTYYDSSHASFFRRRMQWFMPPKDLEHMAMWWIPAGHVPTPAEAKAKLSLITKHGPSQEAFTFKQRFDPPDA